MARGVAAEVVTIREMNGVDLPAVMALNNAEVPAVNRLGTSVLAALVGEAEVALVAARGDALVGFLVGLGPKLAYASDNYQFFNERFSDFLYVDRIVVAPPARQSGVGAGLYRGAEAATSARFIGCEVNLRPPNPGSLAFHLALGFAAIGRQECAGGSRRVVLLAKRLTGSQRR